MWAVHLPGIGKIKSFQPPAPTPFLSPLQVLCTRPTLPPARPAALTKFNMTISQWKIILPTCPGMRARAESAIGQRFHQHRRNEFGEATHSTRMATQLRHTHRGIVNSLHQPLATPATSAHACTHLQLARSPAAKIRTTNEVCVCDHQQTNFVQPPAPSTNAPSGSARGDSVVSICA